MTSQIAALATNTIYQTFGLAPHLLLLASNILVDLSPITPTYVFFLMPTVYYVSIVNANLSVNGQASTFFGIGEWLMQNMTLQNLTYNITA